MTRHSAKRAYRLPVANPLTISWASIGQKRGFGFRVSRDGISNPHLRTRNSKPRTRSCFLKWPQSPIEADLSPPSSQSVRFKHHNQNKTRAVDHHGQVLDPGQEIRKGRQEDRPENRAQDRSQAAYDDHAQELNRDQEVEG